ncbi:MAG: MATE family efflux transporter [Clostridiales bacterium]|nr:MATE family efflux transporter [Clostridiales bacterium]
MGKTFFERDRGFYRAMVRLSLPTALRSLLSLLVLMADNVMVSRFSENALGPVSQANAVSTFVTAALTGLGSGAVVLIAQYWGKKDQNALKRVFSVGFLACTGLGLLFSAVVLLFPRAILSLVLDAGQGELTAVAQSYLMISCLAYVPLGISTALSSALRGVEVVRVTLYATVVSLLSNVALNYLLIYGHLGLPRMGVEGAALATVIARIIEAAVVWVYCFRVQRAVAIRPLDLLCQEKWAWRDYLRFGAPVGFTDAQWALVGLLKMAAIGHLGGEMMNAMNLTDTMMNLGTMFTFALAGGACVLVGKAVGEGDMEKVRRYSRTIQVMFAVIGVGMALIVMALRFPFIGLYGQTKAVETLSGQMIFIGALTLMGTSYHASCFVGINRGAGDNQFVMKVDLICGWLVVLPLTYLGAFVFHWPLPIVFLCTRIDQCFKWIIAFIRLRGKRWIKNVTRT